LNAEQDKLQSQRGFQERVATSISDQMNVETQELISLFGVRCLILRKSQYPVINIIIIAVIKAIEI
jgi:hypothetical protein